MSGRRPHFLEVFLPNLSSNRLKVPSKFVKHLGGRTSGSLSLVGPSGNIWHVNLFEYNGHLFFQDGWSTFVKDHSIECGDSLVFEYDGDSNFTVQIFDQSSCEKDEAFYANCTQLASECCENLGKKRERDVEAPKLKIVAEKKMRGSWLPVNLYVPAENKEHKLKTRTKNCQDFRKTVTSGHDITTKNFAQSSDRTVVLAIAAPRGPDGMANSVDFRVRKIASKVKKVLKKTIKTHTQNIPSISKFIESKAAQYFTSTFPYFVRVMCYSNISGNSTLKIPTHFSRLHFPNCRIKVTLMNLDGKCWIVNSIPSAKQHMTTHTLCGGWIAFVRGNSIKIEDVCIFELVGNFEMRVRVIRLGLEGMECQIGSIPVDDDGVTSGRQCLGTVENVAQATGVHPSKDLEQTIEPCTFQDNKHEKKTYKRPYMLQEAASSIGTVAGSIFVKGPAYASKSSIETDDLLVCNAGETISYQTSANNQLDLQAVPTKNMQPRAEEASEAVAFNSPFPSFMKVMMSSNVGGSFTLAVPRKFSTAYLPCYKTEVILRNLRGESWNVTSGRYGYQTKFYGGWMSFARMNGLKVGDTCVFELIDERVLQVRVFEGRQKALKNLNDEAVADDLTVSIESIQFRDLPEL